MEVLIEQRKRQQTEIKDKQSICSNSWNAVLDRHTDTQTERQTDRQTDTSRFYTLLYCTKKMHRVSLSG